MMPGLYQRQNMEYSQNKKKVVLLKHAPKGCMLPSRLNDVTLQSMQGSRCTKLRSFLNIRRLASVSQGTFVITLASAVGVSFNKGFRAPVKGLGGWYNTGLELVR